MTPEELLNEVKAAARSGRWLNCTVPIDTAEGPIKVGIKAYGKWVQRMESAGVMTGVPERRTWKEFDPMFLGEVANLLRTAGIRQRS